jgi:hypothetical protein
MNSRSFARLPLSGCVRLVKDLLVLLDTDKSFVDRLDLLPPLVFSGETGSVLITDPALLFEEYIYPLAVS